MGRKKGFKHSEETRQKMHLSRIGFVPSEATIKKISEINRGRKRTPEQLLNMAIGWRQKRAERLGIDFVNTKPTAKEIELCEQLNVPLNYIPIDDEQDQPVQKQSFVNMVMSAGGQDVIKKIDIKAFVAKHGRINLFG